MMKGNLQGSESILYDQSDLEKWRIIESMTVVPRRTFYGSQVFTVETTFGNRTISRGELAYFNQQGIQGLFKSEGDPDECDIQDADERRYIENELLDGKQSSQILVQFIGFKPKQQLVNQIINQDYTPQSIYSEEAAIPNRVVFNLNFFDFPQFTTEPLVFQNATDVKSFKETLSQGQPLIFIREAYLNEVRQYKEPIYKFEIEPSKSTYPNQFQLLSQYLFSKCMTIEMWDYDSQQLFGSIKIPLRGLLRQQKNQSVITRQVDIISPSLSKIMGQLTVVVKNIGKYEQIQDLNKTEKFQNSKLGNNSHMIKRKIVSTQPISTQNLIHAQKQQGNTNEYGEFDSMVQKDNPNDNSDRIQERIKRFKLNKVQEDQSKLNSTSNYFKIKQSNHDKQQQLNQINQFKDQKKQNLLKSVLQEHISDEKIIHAQMGNAEIIQVPFKNTTNQQQTFQIIIYDPDYQFTNLNELSIINNPNEWKYLVNKDNYQNPPEFDMIRPISDPTQYLFSLYDQESVTILFKFLFYREPDLEIKGQQDTQDILAKRGNDYIKKFCFPRSLAIYINIKENSQAVGGMRIKLFPHINYIDHIYRFFERDNHRVKLFLPPVFSNSQIPREADPILYCNDPNVQLEWKNETNEKFSESVKQTVIVSLRVPQIKQSLNFRIMAYGDTYKRELIANWMVQVNALSGLGIEVSQGQVEESRLTIHSDTSRQVKFYSSHPLTVWFPAPFDRNYQIIPGKINIITISIRQFSEQITRVLVTCVDLLTKELVQSWILNISPTIPSITQVFDLKCPIDQSKNFIFPYTNKSNQDNTLTFVSSHPEILQLLESKVQFRSNEKQDIRVKIQKKTDIKHAEIKVYVGDEDNSQDTSDCLLFRIQFVQK